MAEIKKINDKSIIKQIARLADEIWHECYAGIITKEQIDYMVSNFQSESAMLSLYENGAEIYVLEDENSIKGYIVLEKEEEARDWYRKKKREF